ncbi:hypothetical protein AB0F77_15195 [Streptomyces sp. NPDC026672]|uniref:hypothetical protein n=1 Tax=unclassified Streptomyces TaxID=2593676 RepID=UPI0033C5B4BC
MNTRSRLPLKSITPTSSGPSAAPQPVDTPAVGEPTGAARKGVVTALRPDPHTVTISGIMPGLQVRFTHPPVADWLCRCGHHERAVGRAAVIELTTRVHVGTCPHTTPTQEGRTAA